LAAIAGATLLPLYDCPMCGNPNPSALRFCYCNSGGKVNLVELLRWPEFKARHVR